MAGSNLVRVGSQLLITTNNFGSSQYGCDNFESVLLHIKKSGAGTTPASSPDVIYITIQAGTETIANRVPLSAFASLNKFLAGTGVNTNWSNSTSTGEAILEVDTGTHYLDKGAELSVSIHNGTNASITADIYAKVNGISTPSPQKWLWRTDTAFMLPLVESLYAFDLDGTANMLEETGNCTLQYGTENVLVPFSAGCAVVNADSIGDEPIENMSLIYDGIPRSMQINTTDSAGTIGFLAQVKEVTSQTMVRKARTWIPNKFKSLSKKERVVLAQGH